MKLKINVMVSAFLMVMFSVINAYVVSHNIYWLIVVVNFLISANWIFIVKKMSISDKGDIVSYLIGSVIGTQIAYVINNLIGRC